MYETRYSITVFPKEGETQIQIEVVPDTGDVCLTLFSPETDKNDVKKYKQIITLTSDMDVKTIIDALRWARLKSLEQQGFKVIT